MPKTQVTLLNTIQEQRPKYVIFIYNIGLSDPLINFHYRRLNGVE